MSGSVAQRADAYKKEGMYVFNKTTMMCKFCEKRVDWERKSTVDNHIKSSAHKSNRAKSDEEQKKKRQVSISESLTVAKKLKESSGDLPNAQQLREKYVPLLKEEYDVFLRSTLKGKKIVVMCDDTTNRKGEAIFLILFKVLPSAGDVDSQIFVASVNILETVNADQCSKTILQTLHQFEVDHDNVVGVVSDSAAYMNLYKYAFSGAKEVKQFPLPVMSRWGSWKRAAVYVSEYAEDVAEYCKTLTGKANETKAVKYFQKLKPQDIMIVKSEAMFVSEYCSPVSALLDKAKKNNEMVTSCGVKTHEYFTSKFINQIESNTTDATTYILKCSEEVQNCQAPNISPQTYAN
ncbi:unnamed protein product [Brassicogethes aeneus]|uniref:CGG triplet repeat-binding protein 1 n=1 Tax=Brassicogethes aeneus TaxID=1431903 RepID=A0A9P0FE92_BRAAE|nr:unnamed protein product [Brassicogethes aeneus]